MGSCKLHLMNDATRSALHRKSIDQTGKNQKVTALVMSHLRNIFRLCRYSIGGSHQQTFNTITHEVRQEN